MNRHEVLIGARPVFTTVCILSFVCAGRARAGDATTQPGSATKQVQSQGGSPLRFTIADWFSPQYHGLQNTRGNTVVFRAYIPWEAASVPQLARLTLPYATASASNANDPANGIIANVPEGPNGLGDIEFYDLSLFDGPYGQFTFGPAFTFPSGATSGVGNGKWTIGPAGGYNTQEGDWKLGVFGQGFFSFAGDPNQRRTAKIKLQPIIDFSLPHDWDLGSSDMNFTYDWIGGRPTNIPLGFEIGKRFEIGSQKMRFSGQAEYNLANTADSSAWTFRFTLEYFPP